MFRRCLVELTVESIAVNLLATNIYNHSNFLQDSFKGIGTDIFSQLVIFVLCILWRFQFISHPSRPHLEPTSAVCEMQRHFSSLSLSYLTHVHLYTIHLFSLHCSHVSYIIATVTRYYH